MLMAITQDIHSVHQKGVSIENAGLQINRDRTSGYKTDHRAVLAFTDQCTSGGTGPYRSALVRTGQHWSVYTREASEIFKLSGC